MYKIRTAKSEFSGTCGHTIAPGSRFVIVEQRPQFRCEKCSKDVVTKAYRPSRSSGEINNAKRGRPGR